MITAQNVRLVLDAVEGQFDPGGELVGRFHVDGPQSFDVRSAELSVLWYTVGKGDEDMAVHHFERLVDEPPAKPLDLRRPHTFRTTLPLGPLSYDGEIVKICWCVRVRIYSQNGQAEVAEAPFRLGRVPAPKRDDASTKEGGPQT